ncbi:hypothetical protein CVT24_007704 [Panaeolus cyanescens]|uniref:F-box domain-containing protein n=1 Tax=Panaeolus cyanescens TaxID=181874 RepID=A0A409VRF3_9AGAR|nr:hypothetical protein CVT24_007704 [Panaeolus cyanescens]
MLFKKRYPRPYSNLLPEDIEELAGPAFKHGTGSSDPYQLLFFVEMCPETIPHIHDVSLKLSRKQFYDVRLQSRLCTALTALCNIESLSIEGPEATANADEPVMWDKLPSPGLRTALRKVVVRPSFESLSLKSISCVPWGDIAAALFLRRLDLTEVTLVNDFNDEKLLSTIAGRCFRHLESLTFCGIGKDLSFLLRKDSSCRNLIFDLQRLRVLDIHLSASSCQACELTAVLKAHPLPELEVLAVKLSTGTNCVCGNEPWGSPLSSWILPHQGTLSTIRISVQNTWNDPYADLVSTMEKMRSRNVLSFLEVEVLVDRGFSANFGRGWYPFVEVLSKPGWDMLEYVKLDIKVVAGHGREPDRYMSSEIELELSNMRYNELCPLFSRPFVFELYHH